MATFKLRVSHVLHNGPGGDGLYYVYFTQAQCEALAWLLANVGSYKVQPKYFDDPDSHNPDHKVAYMLPMEGLGWRIAEGFQFDRPVDVNLNNFEANITPLGPYGDWLCIDDEDTAMQFARMGFIEREN